MFANVRAVLDASGALGKTLVDVTVYLTDMAGDFKAYNVVWAEFFPNRDGAVPHDAGDHRVADADFDELRVRRRRQGVKPCFPTRSTCRPGSMSTATC